MNDRQALLAADARLSLKGDYHRFARLDMGLSRDAYETTT